MVVDFAVENDPACAVFVGDGLVSACDVDDAESAVAEADGAFDVEAFVVRPAVRDHGGHVVDESLGDGALEVEGKFSADAAHVGGLGFFLGVAMLSRDYTVFRGGFIVSKWVGPRKGGVVAG